MSEEVTKAPEVEAPAPPAGPTPEELREIAFKWLNEAPPEEILSHTRVGGIVGQRMQTSRLAIQREEAQKAAERARLETEAEFERLANDDPAEFSKRFLSVKEQERLRNQQASLAASIQEDFATGIGEAMKSIPEWQDITPEEFSRLQAALAGKQGRDVMAAFTVTAAEIVSDRKAEKRLAEYKAKELPKEREAIRTEEAAKRLQTSDRPDIANGSSTPTKFDPTKLSEKDFESYYRKTFLGRM